MPVSCELNVAPEHRGSLEKTVRGARHLPLYSQHPFTEAQPLSRFQEWPLITKADIRRDFPANFLGDPAILDELLAAGRVELEFTSGTSEQRTPLILPTGWWRDQELRAFRLNAFVAGVLEEHPEARRVTITSPACNNDISYAGSPSCADRVVGASLFVALSRLPFLWGERDLARMTREALDWNPLFLDIDPVYGVAFARYCERQGICFPELKFIICSYEFLSQMHRRVLERVFRVPVFNLFGSTETGHLMMEDYAGVLRPVNQTAFLEILNPGLPGLGELIVTTLTNPFMPLLRYRIGDLVRPRQDPSGTGYELHGRALDLIQTRSGEPITMKDLDDSLAGLSGILHYELRQVNSHFHFKWIRDQGTPAPNPRDIRERLRQVTGGAPIEAREVDLLLPLSSGKFRMSGRGQ